MAPLDLREWGKVSGGSASFRLTPQLIPGLLAWFDPRSQYVARDGSDRVSAYTSREGNGYVISQAGGTAQLLWEDASLLGQPSLYAVTDDYLAGVIALAGLIDGSAACTVVQVVKLDNDATTRTIVAVGDSGSSANGWILYSQNNGGQPQAIQYFAQVPAGSTANNTATNIGTAAEYVALLHTGAAVSFEIGGTPVAGGANTRAPACDLFSLGARRLSGAWATFMNGRYGQTYIYDHVLLAAEMTQLEGFIASEYPTI